MKRILIVGTGGYIGSKLCQLLIENDQDVVAHFKNEVPAWAEKLNLSYVLGDITEEKTLKELASIESTHVVYTISFPQKITNSINLSQVSQTNVEPLWKLLELLSKTSVENFIYLSTVHVLGRGESSNFFSESSAHKPFDFYGLTHELCENILSFYNKKFNCLNLRLSNGYGSPVSDDAKCWHLIINDLCRTAVTKGYVQLQSDGLAKRDFIHIKDVSSAILYLMKEGWDDAINVIHVSSGMNISMYEIAKIVLKQYQIKFGEKIPFLNVDGEPFKYDKNKESVPYPVVNNDLLKSFGYIPVISIEKGVDELLTQLKGQ